LKKGNKGRFLEIAAILIGGFNFCVFIFMFTKLPVIVGWLGWIVCGFAYSRIKHREDNSKNDTNIDNLKEIKLDKAQNQNILGSEENLSANNEEVCVDQNEYRLPEAEEIIVIEGKENRTNPEPEKTKQIENADKKRSNVRQRYCKYCGHEINSNTKKCTGCGKQYFKFKVKPFVSVLVVLFLVVTYFGVNYFCAVSAMNDEEFIKAKQYMDNTFVGERLFKDKYEYIEAGVLKEEGKYIESLNAFNQLHDIPVPESIRTSLVSFIYTDGVADYRAGKYADAERSFNSIKNYKRSKDYLFLVSYFEIDTSNTSFEKYTIKNHYIYDGLIDLIGFENTNEILIRDRSYAKKFLTGRWENSSYYFEVNNNGAIYNLPNKDTIGAFYDIENGVYYTIESESTSDSIKQFEFSIIDEDTISVYCYKDGSTHKLYRQ